MTCSPFTHQLRTKGHAEMASPPGADNLFDRVHGHAAPRAGVVALVVEVVDVLVHELDVEEAVDEVEVRLHPERREHVPERAPSATAVRPFSNPAVCIVWRITNEIHSRA